ncbi:protein cereblon-like [Uranotaenia lowii]|uniref:protein cereblon-like n=1 Tax=Uranotaenia lowii TaxID=190385 RepID=UPI00247AF5F7|nr:protein cereblon-like [Uranotaenia lowii]
MENEELPEGHVPENESNPQESSLASAEQQDPAESNEQHQQRMRRMRLVQASIHHDPEDEDPDSSDQDAAPMAENLLAPEVNEPVDVVMNANEDEEEAEELASTASGDRSFSSNSSENGLDDSDADRLFDDYITSREQHQSTTAEIYNTELPTEHTYLGKLERVEGVDYLEPGKVYRLPVWTHTSIVFPGEIVPMIINDSTLNCNDPSDGVKFALVFRCTFPRHFVYGVTCQVFERGESDARGTIVLKAIAQQRFHTVRHLSGLRADVLILPEILLPDPLLSNCSNHMKRLAICNNKMYSNRLRAHFSHGMVWPKFVYDQYGTEQILAKVERYLALLNITSVPNDPVKLSFWLARNVSLDEKDRKLIYQEDAVISRMLVINKSLDNMCYFVCKRCENEIGSYNDLFAMSKQGIQTSYCNPQGFVHETLTIYKTKDDSTFNVDRPSTEFSWFPGYSWQITLCTNCRQHLGWKFVATKKNYLPKSFYGLTGSNIKVKSVPVASTSANEGADEDEEMGVRRSERTNDAEASAMAGVDSDDSTSDIEIVGMRVMDVLAVAAMAGDDVWDNSDEEDED